MKTDKLANLAISDTGFIFDPISGHSYSGNEIGIMILNMLKKNKDLPQIVDTLSQEYEVTPEELEKDVIDFIQHLTSYFLIYD